VIYPCHYEECSDEVIPTSSIGDCFAPLAMTFKYGKKIMTDKNLVYSTDPDWKEKCSDCGELLDQCICKKKKSPAGQGKKIYIERDRKQRKGKTVTVISGMSGDLKSQLKELQRLCGAGGAVKGGNLEIQGDHRVKIRQYLEKKGLQVINKGG
jgi:translation initiation factor 1